MTKIKTDLNQLANNLFKEVDKLEFSQLRDYIISTLRQYGFKETSHISFYDGGIPAGNINRQAFYSSDLQAVAVIELSQDWDDYYDYETDQIEWRDYYYYRIYIYNSDKPFDNDDLYFLGDHEDNIIFYYSTNNFDELYYED